MSLSPEIAALIAGELNPQQQNAAISGPAQALRIIAGPGTGKTKTLAYRFLALTAGRNIPPHRVLALTFTEKAALEMQERVAALLPTGARPWISTFHGFAARLLYEAAQQQESGTVGAILNELDRQLLQTNLYAEILNEPALAERYPTLDFGDAQLATAVFAAIERLRDAYQSPEAVLANLPPTSDLWPEQTRRDLMRFTAQVYAAYRARLLAQNKLDFAELVYLAYYALKDNTALRDHYQKRFVHILVDEFQDTSLSQLEFLRLLSPRFANITVVGDRKQSIYGWRNARPENFEDAALLQSQALALTHNYRSHQPILDAAATVLQPLAGSKVLAEELALRAHKTSPDEHQAVILARPADSVPKEDAQAAEAAFIAAEITRLRQQPGYEQKSIAILLRSVRTASQPYEAALQAAGIDYVTVGGGGFYAQQEVLNLVAVLRLLCNSGDGKAFYRVATAPRFRLSQGLLQKLAELARRHASYELGNDPVFEQGLALYLETASSPREIEQLQALQTFLAEGRAQMQTSSITATVNWAIENLHLNRPQSSVLNQQAEANARKLLELAQAFEQARPQAGLPELAEYLTLWIESDLPEQEAPVETEAGSASKAVQIMTVHQSKGLEFDIVFVARQKPFKFSLNRPGQSTPLFVYLPGREDLFPGGFALLSYYDPAGGGRARGPDYPTYAELEKARSLEEERYILYVALTRARERLYVTTPLSRLAEQAQSAKPFFFRELAENQPVTEFSNFNHGNTET